jgi:hypothetical protein
MALRRPAAALSLLLACASYPTAPSAPPSDPRERQRAELAACSGSKLPPWLDDDALTRAIALDRREAQASVSNEGFHGATYTSQPPALQAEGPHASALFRERGAFERWCAGIKARAAPPPR